VLVIVEDRDVHALAQLLLDVEAFRRLDVFQVDAADGRLQHRDRVHQFIGIEFVQLQVEHVDAGELLEQAALAFHDRLRGQRADVAQAEHGGFYQAQATGLYQHAGLDVEIKMGGPQINVMQLMAAGQADCTLGDNGQALETWQAGVHAVTVATVFQHSPTVFITHDKVENPAELKDKTFLLATEAYTSFWPWAKSELGLAGSKVRPYTFNVQPFLADKNLVQQGYVTSPPEPFSVAKGGQPFYVYPLSDWGYPPYGNSIICMADTIRKRPAAVAAFVKASMEGWKSYLQDPTPGNSLIGKANPQMGAEQIAFGIAQMKQYQLVTGGDAKTGGIGIITEPRLKKTWDMLVKNKLIDASKVPFEQTYTLEMVKDAGVMP